jgi:hypothetical protein
MVPSATIAPSARKVAAWALLLPCIYLPTLLIPFDFVDDGALVYPIPSPSPGAGARRVWERSVGEFQTRGPFRPVSWAHWEAAADLLGPHAPLRRLARLAWAALSAGIFLWLLMELGFPLPAAVGAVALSLWNPSRGEIWVGLGLTEAFAMPYALLALLGAVRASRSPRPLRWDVLTLACLLAALGIKNTFAALVPPVVLLRLTAGGLPLREGWRRHRAAACVLGLTLALPAVHFVLYKVSPATHDYEVQFTWLQGPRMARAVLAAANYEFVLLGLVLPLAALWLGRCNVDELPSSLLRRYRPALLAGLLLTVLGIGMYVPINAVAGRYTLPAAWGLDLVVAFLLTALLEAGPSFWKRLSFAALAGWLLFLGGTSLDRQWKYRARAELLWEALEYVEARAPRGAAVAWLGTSSVVAPLADMPFAEANHFSWHLRDRGRDDLSLRTVEAAAPGGLRDGASPCLVVAGTPPPEGDAGWELARHFRVRYRAGTCSYECFVWSRTGAGARAGR